MDIITAYFSTEDNNKYPIGYVTLKENGKTKNIMLNIIIANYKKGDSLGVSYDIEDKDGNKVLRGGLNYASSRLTIVDEFKQNDGNYRFLFSFSLKDFSAQEGIITNYIKIHNKNKIEDETKIKLLVQK